ncbi:FtsK/SpoIIIE domain-containing protein [Micromonospora tulbaghiae]|uniref:FtsK/SpoIIIE domain-containing protein n=1 Tax=Micromonospora tulbaghiae TaxID=479978 RepID=UPI00341FE681
MTDHIPHPRHPDDDDHETVDITPAPEGPPVDQPERKPVFAAIVGKPAERRPIVPAGLRKGNLAPTVKQTAGRAGHVAAYHAVRAPFWYVPLALLWACWGAVRLVAKLLKWWLVLEQEPLRQEAATRNDPDAWMKLHREAKATRLYRGVVLGAIAVGVLVGVVVLAVSPGWYSAVVAAVVVPLLARYGRPADKPIVSPAVVKPQYRRLTAELVRSAILSCGIAGLKEPEQITFPQEIHRDGPGQLAIVDLPPGVDAVDVIERRSRLASGLRVPVDQVWPETMPKAHPGRLAIWQGYQPASAMKQPPWPLLKGAKVDIFKPFPFATDPRLRPVMGQLIYRNWLIGAMPGAGKTFSLRELLLVAALDPTAELIGYELKGTGDLDMLEPICTKYGSGADDDTVEDALDMLRWLREECVRRGAVIKRMARAGKAPENKVTRELANMPDLGLHPVVAFVDECQELFAHSEFGKEAGDLAEKVIKLGRALGIVLLLATQRPDKDSLPKGVSANAGVRWCLRVTGQVENDMVLGTSMYKQGIRATMFGDEDYGWGWLVGLGKPVSARGYYVDGPGAKRIVEHAIRHRQGAGTMPDLHEPAPKVKAYNLLADIRAVWPGSEEALWSELIVDRLQRLRPEIYGDWTVTTLGAALKATGVKTVSIHRKLDGMWTGNPHPEGRGWTKYGVRLDTLQAALDAGAKPREIAD